MAVEHIVVPVIKGSAMKPLANVLFALPTVMVKFVATMAVAARVEVANITELGISVSMASVVV
jgi:hypothetical protein